MVIDMASLKPAQVYFHMVQTLVPRPVAWVLSEIEQDKYNLALFSYFNAVCSDPPLIMLSVGKKPDGSLKDTRVNIERHKDFVIHIAQRDMLEDINASSATVAADISELEQLGIPVLAGIYGTNPAGGGYQGISPTILFAHKNCNIAVGGAGIVGGMAPKGGFDLAGAGQIINAQNRLRAKPPGRVDIHFNDAAGLAGDHPRFSYKVANVSCTRIQTVQYSIQVFPEHRYI